MNRLRPVSLLPALLLSLAPLGCSSGGGKGVSADHYEAYVWPPPPDTAKIRLSGILTGRPDVEAESKLQKAILGAGAPSRFDWLQKPYAVAFDGQGRILVTDQLSALLFRFDRTGRKLDVFGVSGNVRLRLPAGVHTSPDGRIFVADTVLKQVVAFDSSGKVVMTYGRPGELTNPTDAIPSKDGTTLFVTDSTGQKVVVFDTKTGKVLSSFGHRGTGEGEFNYPTSIALTAAGDLLVVDQMNARIQEFSPSGEFVDQFGARGTGFGAFVRPKNLAVDDMGWVYVPDAAFNNVQIFDPEYNLLTFVGSGGEDPGQFNLPSSVAVRGDEFAVVDQINRRVQIFRYIVPRKG